jgi:hypothetical protein
MDIRFISSLTPDDETRLAKALIGAIEKLLDQFPIAYTIRIETATNQVFDHHHTPVDPSTMPAPDADPLSVMASIDRTTRFLTRPLSDPHKSPKRSLAD